MYEEDETLFEENEKLFDLAATSTDGERIQASIANGGNPNVTLASGETPLHVAAATNPRPAAADMGPM